MDVSHHFMQYLSCVCNIMWSFQLVEEFELHGNKYGYRSFSINISLLRQNM